MSADRKPVKGETWTSPVTETPYTCVVDEPDPLRRMVWQATNGTYGLYRADELRPPAPPRPALPEPEVRYWTINEYGLLHDSFGSLEEHEDFIARGGRRQFGIARETTSYEWVEDPS